MTLGFRNVDAAVSDPVESWPQEALRTALERGDISHWRRIVAAIRISPWGPVARGVEEILSYSQPYGVAGLMERAIAAAREEAARSEVAEVSAKVRSAQATSGLTVGAFAERCGTSGSRVSTYLSGKVVPSAAMLVRMERVARREQASRSPAPDVAQEVVADPDGTEGR